ncbi:Carbamoyl-phosphate synthase (glutamine-hydrolyzing) [Altererythrobacter insulae]|nr:Carbamoyl-phosphate synthase (glutamine-hydrolyzing) [Altererythrobacter insulae]
MIRVLVTCAGGGVGQSVVDSLKNDKEKYFVVASDQRKFIYAAPDCDSFVDLPSIFAPNYVQRVVEACRDHDIDIVIPGHDQELELFALARNAFGEVGTAVVVSDYELVKLLRNKLAWSREFRKHTGTVARSYSVDELHTRDDLRFPMIAKPTGGSASTGLHVLHSSKAAIGLPDDLVVQEFLFPPSSTPEYEAVKNAVDQNIALQVAEVSVQLVYSLDSSLVGRFASINRLSNGVPVEIVPVDQADIWHAVSEIETILKGYSPRGPINLQGRITDAGLVFFEMNPRFTGITGNRAQFGFNEVDAVCRSFVEGDNVSLRTNFGKVGVRQVACRAWPKARFAFSSGKKHTYKNILILGGTSWLGRTFVEQSADEEMRFVLLVRPNSMDKAREFFGAFENVELVALDSPGVKNCLGWADVCLNLASARPPDGAVKIRQSHDFQLRWLTYAAVANVPKIVNVSSQSVYQPSGEIWHENSPVDVSTPYAFSKYGIEAHLDCITQMHPQVSTTSLRLSRLFGPAGGLRESEFPHLCVQRAIGEDEITLTAPHSVLDLLDIRDAVSAIKYFIKEDHLGVFNIGSGHELSISEYVDAVSQRVSDICGAELKVNKNAAGSSSKPEGGYMSCAKAKSVGWRNEFELTDTIDDLIAYFASSV